MSSRRPPSPRATPPASRGASAPSGKSAPTSSTPDLTPLHASSPARPARARRSGAKATGGSPARRPDPKTSGGSPARRPGASAPRGSSSRGSGSNRPGGRTTASTRPGARSKPRSSSGGSGIEFTSGGETYSISWRILVLTLVLAVAFVLISPTLSLYMRQQAEERALNEEMALTEARIEQLEAEIARWDDPAFVQAQARERLGYVLPGQQPYIVVDPEVVIGEEAQEEFERAQTSLPPELRGPWYVEMWDSVQIAGNTRLTDPDAAPQPAEPSPEPTTPAEETPTEETSP